MKLITFLILVFPLIANANLTGKYSSSFKRDKMECIIESELTHFNRNSLQLNIWDEYCEDEFGNSYSSSLEDEMTFERISNNRIKVIQGTESVELDASYAIFNENEVKYDFTVETENGKLEIIESYLHSNNKLYFNSRYILDGQIIIDKSGILNRILMDSAP